MDFFRNKAAGAAPGAPGAAPGAAPSGTMERVASTLTSVLLRNRFVNRDAVERAVVEQAGTNLYIGEFLVERGDITDAQLSIALAEHFGLPAYDLDVEVTETALGLVPNDFAEKYVVLPIEVDADGTTLSLATATPQNAELFGFIEDRTGKQLKLYVASTAVIRQGIANAYGTMNALDTHVEAFDGVVIDRADRRAELEAMTEDAPVVKVVNIIVSEGLRQRASDIHIEPEEDGLRVRYRIDGTLVTVQNLPKKMSNAVASRIKVMADLDIVEKHKAQDGQMVVNVDGRVIDVRVATAETIWGEKIVLRLLDRSKALISLQQLGMPADVASQWSSIVQIPFGMVVVTGPTGAGKTTTLYASLLELDKATRNITTIEDPVEYIFAGITQMPIKAPKTFADGLKAILRQDPDVVLVGEIRDRETAEIAAQAALTGHTVFCSVHATNSVSTIFRLLDIGCEPYLIAPALEAIVSQRLVRKICSQCAVETTPTSQELAIWKYLTGSDRDVFWQGQGCDQCNGSGYFGRVGIYELLRMDDELRNMIVHSAPQTAMREYAESTGMVTLLKACVRKVDENETTIAELIRSVYSG